MMRVAFDGRALQPGFREHQGRGIGVYAVELVRTLARRGDIELTVWHQPELPLPAAHVPAGVATRAYPRLALPARDRLASQLTVPAALAVSRHDVFHFPAHGDAPARGGRGVVVTVHDLILEVMARDYDPRRTPAFRLARTLERAAVRHARAVVTDSAVTRKDVETFYGVPHERVRVAHLGLHPRFVRPAASVIAAARERLGLPHPYVLYLGGIDARKDVPCLLAAWAHARSTAGETMDLVIAGRVREAREFPALLDRARALGIESTLRFPGHVADDDLPALHAGARVFAFPSRYEGFGFPPLEAMACGTPVVSSGGGSLREVLGDAALVTPPGYEAAFAQALMRLLGDEALRRDLAARGPAHAAGFTWERTAEATVAAYRDVVRGRDSR
jgi:glycosyltransferase involved in cell wall biosynthesis